MNVKRFLVYFVSTVLILSGLLFINPVETRASGYSPEAALEYAANHWDDGKGLCAEFVSDCVIAGGLDMPVCPMVYYCVPAIVNASGIQPQTLKLDSWGLATKELDGDILAPGDVVFHYCNTHPDSIRVMPHIMLCAGYDEEGYAVFYAHNGACNRRRIRLNINTAYEHERDCDMVGKVIHLSGGPTGYNPEGAHFFTAPGESTFVLGDNITINKSVLLNDVPVSSINSVVFKISDLDGNVLAEKNINYTVENDVVKIKVDVRNDIGVDIQSGNYYVYEFTIEAGQRKIKSSSYSVLATEPNTINDQEEEALSMDSYLDAVYSPDAQRDEILSRKDGSLLDNQKTEPKPVVVKNYKPSQLIFKSFRLYGNRRIDTKGRGIFNKSGFGLRISSYYRYNNKIKRVIKKSNVTASDNAFIYKLMITNNEPDKWSRHLLRKRG